MPDKTTVALPELPDQYEAAAHMFPCDLAEFKEREMGGESFSLPCGSPTHGHSVPLWTSDQMRAYATAALAQKDGEFTELRSVLKSLYDAYCSAMRSEFDFPGRPWTPDRDDDDAALRARAALGSQA